MLYFPNAKINIGLRVLEKRSDGFHNIETLFCPVSLSDILEVAPADSGQSENVAITVTGGIDTGDNLNNLCVRAYDLLREDYDIPPIRIHLHKVIPVGAGLGGGSSDAAFTLKAINDLFKPGISDEGLINYAMRLGSDCAFFIRNKPMLGYGRGDILKEIDYFPAGLHAVIVNPGIHISTAEAYGGVKPEKAGTPLSELVDMPVTEWRNNILNVFETSIFKKHPVIERIKESMYDLGAIYASMTGSGSSVYGLFSRKPNLAENFRDFFCYTGRILSEKERLTY